MAPFPSGEEEAMDRPVRALFVSDSADDAEAVKEALAQAGVEIALESRATEAGFKAALSSATWDLVLARHPGPWLGAARVLELTGGLSRDLPVIVVSDDGDDDDLAALMRAGAHDCVPLRRLGRLGRRS